MANPIVQQKYSIHSQVNRASLVEAKSVPFVFLLLLFASSRFNLLLNETERRRETKLQSPEMRAKKQPPAAAKLVSKTGWHTWHQIRSIHHTISIPSFFFQGCPPADVSTGGSGGPPGFTMTGSTSSTPWTGVN